MGMTVTTMRMPDDDDVRRDDDGVSGDGATMVRRCMRCARPDVRCVCDDVCAVSVYVYAYVCRCAMGVCMCVCMYVRGDDATQRRR